MNEVLSEEATYIHTCLPVCMCEIKCKRNKQTEKKNTCPTFNAIHPLTVSVIPISRQFFYCCTVCRCELHSDKYSSHLCVSYYNHHHHHRRRHHRHQHMSCKQDVPVSVCIFKFSVIMRTFAVSIYTLYVR